MIKIFNIKLNDSGWGLKPSSNMAPVHIQSVSSQLNCIADFSASFQCHLNARGAASEAVVTGNVSITAPHGPSLANGTLAQMPNVSS